MAETIVAQPIYVDLTTVAQLTTLSASTIQSMVVRNMFPAPRELSGRRVAWLYREVMEWAEKRPVSDMPPPPNTGSKRRKATDLKQSAPTAQPA